MKKRKMFLWFIIGGVSIVLIGGIGVGLFTKYGNLIIILLTFIVLSVIVTFCISKIKHYDKTKSLGD